MQHTSYYLEDTISLESLALTVGHRSEDYDQRRQIDGMMVCQTRILHA